MRSSGTKISRDHVENRRPCAGSCDRQPTRRKPPSHISVTTKPISSMCASSSTSGASGLPQRMMPANEPVGVVVISSNRPAVCSRSASKQALSRPETAVSAVRRAICSKHSFKKSPPFSYCPVPARPIRQRPRAGRLFFIDFIDGNRLTTFCRCL